MHIHLGIAGGVLAAGVFFRLSRLEWLAVILVMLLVLCGELMNTAIEKTVDLASPQYHVLAGQAKDIAAGAVFLAAVGAVFVGGLVFLPHSISLFQKNMG